MTAVEQHLRELDGALHVRGRARRRLLAECRDHLVDASAVHGDGEAVRRFGAAAELASAFDTEIAVRRAMRATIATIVGVLAVGASTVALLNATDPHASAVVAWAVFFFACAQTSAVSALLAALRAAGMRNRPATPADVALLCRRNGSALTFALMALFAAGAAVPGHGSAMRMLLGPAVAALATLLVLRTRSLARQLDAYSHRTFRAPWSDLRAVAHLPVGTIRPIDISSSSVLLVVAAAAAAAFAWDHLDQGNIASSLTAAAIEAALTILGFLLLGPTLGLRSARTDRHSSASV